MRDELTERGPASAPRPPRDEDGATGAEHGLPLAAVAPAAR